MLSITYKNYVKYYIKIMLDITLKLMLDITLKLMLDITLKLYYVSH